MSDTILGGNITVYYLGDNRQKRLEWTGGDAKHTLNEVYSALSDLFDEPIQMDDGIPMSFQTPIEYTIGIIDAGDLDPWYISYECMEHLYGGALKTAGWTHVDSSATGIIVVPVLHSTNNIVTGDIGEDITGATTGVGTLLDVIEGDPNDFLVIRPDDNTAAKQFTTDTQVITEAGTSHTAAQVGAISNTGEQVWANLYSIGTIEPDTHIYVYQGTIANDSRKRITSIVDTTQDWWLDGHVDRCFYIKDFTTAAFDTIDDGYLTVFARKYSNLFDSFEVSTSVTSGGRNPIPLATSPDLDNTTGYKSITFTAATGNWSVGDEMTGDNSDARAIITDIVTPGATQVVHYYLIDDPLIDFDTSIENLTNEDDTGTGTKDGNAPADQGPALSTWYTTNTPPTVAYGNTTADIDDGGVAEGYGITIDCKANPLPEVYEWIKYTFRRGNTSDTEGNGIEEEQYIGAVVYLKYTGSVSVGTIDEGDGVVQTTTGATGVVISHDTTLKEILLRNTRGDFATGYVLTAPSPGGLGVVTIDSAAETFAPKKVAPLGTFAGGTFFGARGVLLDDWKGTDENLFQLTDSAGNIRVRPVAITLAVSNLVGTDESTITDDRVTVFRLEGAGGYINKTEYSAVGGEAIGGTTLAVDTAIAKDVPGKTTGGILRIRDDSNGYKEYRIRYASWATSTFTLANIDIASADAGTNTTTIVKTGAFTTAKRGDIVVNEGNGHNGISYVVSVDSNDQVTISPAITGQTDTDHIELNAIPIAVDTADYIYIPFIDKYATSATEEASVVYDAQIYFLVRVRNSAAVNKIVSFSTSDTTTGTDKSVPTIRTPDNIYT